MTKMEVVNKATRALNKVKFKFKKHSPELLVGVGIVGVVASGVLACKATLKVNAVLEESKQNIDKIHEATEKGATAIGEEYTVEDSKKDLTITYTQTAVKLVKLYGPSVLLGGAAIAAIIGGHKILRTRNVALAAAYATVEKSFKDYRGRVVERFGEALDKELKYNIKSQEVEEIVVNEDGSEQVVKNTVTVVDPNNIDDTSRIWYEGNPGFTKDPEHNLRYLKLIQATMNDKLKAQGYLPLNDVYEALGFDKTSYGQVLGWIYDEKNPIGDNFVDFGLYDIHDENKIRFVNGKERAIILEFNHDGNIVGKF